MSRPVKIVDYDSRWPILYEKEKRLILDVIEHIIVRIEHIESTAVPGLGAKPTIDIMVAVNHSKTLSGVLNLCKELVMSIGLKMRF